MVNIESLQKCYSKYSGNFDINLKISEGEVYGIVGPNGAGKTTLIRQILGFVKPESGVVTVSNLNSWKNREKIMEFTGYIPGENTIYDFLTGQKYLEMNYLMKDNSDKEYLNYLIEYFEIDTTKKIKKMSKGNKQKIAIISAIMNRPKFLVLDEPTSGLDPIMQIKMMDLLKKINKEDNVTIIICSHILDEVANIADKVAFLSKGRLLEEFILVDRNVDELNKKFVELFNLKGFNDEKE